MCFCGVASLLCRKQLTALIMDLQPFSCWIILLFDSRLILFLSLMHLILYSMLLLHTKWHLWINCSNLETSNMNKQYKIMMQVLPHILVSDCWKGERGCMGCVSVMSCRVRLPHSINQSIKSSICKAPLKQSSQRRLYRVGLHKEPSLEARLELFATNTTVLEMRW